MIGEMPSKRTKMPLLKVRGGMQIEIVSLCREPLGFHSHWLGTRSYMCPGIDCPACFAAVGTRWVGFMPVSYKVGQEETARVGVLELTAGAYDAMAGLTRMLGLKNLFGVRFSASRRSKRASLRVEPLDSVDSVPIKVQEFPEHLLLDAMATLYGLPSCPDELDRASWEALAIPKATAMIRQALPRALGGPS